jgi:molybdopterin-containing oxidoreductase family membrane subunit
MFRGIEGHNTLVPWMWTGMSIAVVSAILLVFPKIRKNERILPFLCVGVIVSIWIEKGMGIVVTGFVPTPLDRIVDYTPTGTELMVTAGVYGIGLLVLTLLYKIVVEVRARQNVT